MAFPKVQLPEFHIVCPAGTMPVAAMLLPETVPVAVIFPRVVTLPF